MQLGWIDFSKSERDKVLGVLELLAEKGTLDELGIAPIRDGFADVFFPGTSTLQTRAKYFLLIPYACKDLERSGITNVKAAHRRLYEIERDTAKKLSKDIKEGNGIIGGGAYASRSQWIKRPPSTLYWAGLRRFGIHSVDKRFEKLSLSDYLKVICSPKKGDAAKRLGNRNDRNDNDDCDDKDAGAEESTRYFSLPTYRSDWKDNLTLELTRAEAEYLRNRICESQPNSLLAYILNKKNKDVCDCDSFEALTAFVEDERLKADCQMAIGFSKFTYVLRVVYNLVVSKGKNQEANEIIEKLYGRLEIFSNIDVDAIFMRLELKNEPLKTFLTESKKAMQEGGIEKLKTLVAAREKEIKKERAKTLNAGSFDDDKWIGGKYLDYRFHQAKQILKDIFDGEERDV